MDQPARTNLGFGFASTTMRESQRLRLATLVRLRWLAVAGQTATCFLVAFGLGYPLPLGWCLVLIVASAALTMLLWASNSASWRLSLRETTAVLAFDIVQLSGLLYLTGGLENPFVILLIVPAVIASATQPTSTTVALGALAVASTTFLAFFHLPLPWPNGTGLALPGFYLAGLWFAVAVSVAFASIVIHWQASEARALSDALAATELVLQREQHLSALDGLAAAAAHELGTPLSTIALIAKDMGASVPADDPRREDVELLITQSRRCREILKRLASLAADSEEHMARLQLLSLVEDVVAPHRNFGITIHVAGGERDGPEPVTRRNAGVLYGLGNLVENAVDFAESEVLVTVEWSRDEVRITITDDGPGFSPEALTRIGDPYMADRERPQRNAGGGLGLGLFIAKILIERSGAAIAFTNRRDKGRTGAIVKVVWPRETFAISAKEDFSEQSLLVERT
ncbi:ActS/PrrB/RegB family redox-sensitive histidine kinase [Consotaella salsifontis]|uniref:histidine kinase n=1 Tax=Consotaella salsifontis TaxID=1365950 RepID=A0A1T4T8K8_9HYPH|nr:ActS/PrrB/RegB family redox-sensitive histidine kinase [Consotaella salsifontis]SKA36815.1 two-component system, sensor histidine kinase RegB [Consotaella salsifontis]